MNEINTSAHTLFRNGRIYTVDRARPWALCVAVGDIKSFVRRDTKTVDLGGRTGLETR